MNIQSAAFVASLLLAAGTGVALAQGTQVRAGDHVRLLAPTAYNRNVDGELQGVQIKGVVRALRDGRVLVRQNNGLDVDIPASAVTELEIATYSGRKIGKGALIGGLFGLALGTVALSAGGDNSGIVNEADIRAGLAGAAVVLGIGVGALVGVGWRTETWHSVPVDQLHAARSPGTVDHQFVVHASVSF